MARGPGEVAPGGRGSSLLQQARLKHPVDEVSYLGLANLRLVSNGSKHVGQQECEALDAPESPLASLVTRPEKFGMKPTVREGRVRS